MREADEGRGYARTLWYAARKAPEADLPLATDVSCDVAIVGAGIVGLSAALHLAERGISCAVVEAGAVGSGASGRNTGFVVPALNASLGPDEIAARLGPERGARLVDLVAKAADTLFDLVRRHAIACDADQRGFIQAVPWARQLPGIAARADSWRRAGAAVELLDGAAAASRMGTPFYRGAIDYTRGGTIDPLAYARGLAARYVALGGKLFAHSPVAGLTRMPDGWMLKTASGGVAARRVLFATNALAGTLVPDLARSQIPVEVHQIATAPLLHSLRAKILPQGGCATDMRRDPVAFRLSADGRLLGGGMAAFAPGSDSRLPPFFMRRFARLFPDLGNPAVDFVWRGKVAVTRGLMPKLFAMGPGCHALIACNGRGNALGTALGAALAQALAADDFADFPLPPEPPAPMALHGLATLSPRLWLPWARLRDRIDNATNPHA
ncbi:MAG: FAD-binding oxidoreductase [Telmatospirillum sp.]|nr:FAD-binding oxidoreductase [Telmatospirillum sp.]